MVPIATAMVEDLRAYWDYRNPLLIFPAAGRGDNDLIRRARTAHARATVPMPYSSLQRLMRLVSNSTIGCLHPHTAPLLCHPSGGAETSLHTVQALLGQQINTTMSTCT
ncbi:MAG: hypothetical protein R3F19_03800 [Verrucomicrobiales bacterium]